MDDKQDMLTVGAECHHGRLKRQCQECDMEQEIKELKEQNAELIEALESIASDAKFYRKCSDNKATAIYGLGLCYKKAKQVINKLRGE